MTTRAKSQFTRSGVRRSGDDYQDIVALDVLVEMLEHPERYHWIRVEADDLGALDDVVALRQEGTLVLIQVKFAAHPEDEEDAWSWARLLEKETSPKGRLLPSLLQRWFSSLTKLPSDSPVHRISLVSNRPASIDLEMTLEPNGRVDFDRIPHEVQAKILQQLGQENDIRRFFDLFHFMVDQPGLVGREEAVQRRFYALGGTRQGWLALKDELRLWVRDRNQPLPDGGIRLEDVRAAAQWNRLQSMPEQYAIPDDFVLPAQTFQREVETRLQAHTNGCLAMVGKPGVGKSTYLSYLSGRLARLSIPVVRHHYYLSSRDRTPGRLDHSRVAESLMSEIHRDYSAALGGLETNNPDHRQLGRWLESCGRYFAAQGKTFVVIVDGLDHVWREQDSRAELDRLFDQLLPAPEGVVIVVGTQPVDDAQLPASLLRAAPRDAWLELPPLDRRAVGKWLRRNAAALGLPQPPNHRSYYLRRLGNAFYERSSGHPLYLKYTLWALVEQRLAVTPETISRLPGCPHEDIVGYYQDLWRGLPETGRSVLYLLAAAPFPWPRRGIIECLDPEGQQLGRVRAALREVSHLLADEPLGLRPFHSSLAAFVTSLADYASEARRIKERALGWLNSAAPEYWRWAYSWIIQAELGNPIPLLDGPSREWVVDAIERHYPESQVMEILGRSAWGAIKRMDLPRFVEIGLLRDYFEPIRSFRPEIPSAMIQAQLYLQDEYLPSRLHAERTALTPSEIVALCRHEVQRANMSGARAILHELIDRQTRPSSTDIFIGGDHRRELADAILKAMSIVDPDAATVVRYARKNRRSGLSRQILDTYCSALRVARMTSATRCILHAKLDRAERSVALRHAVLLALEEGSDLPEAVLAGSNAFSAIYRILRSTPPQDFELISFPSTEVMELQRFHLYDHINDIRDLYYESFFCFLVNHLQGSPDANAEWLDALRGYSWPRLVLAQLESIAQHVAQDLRSGGRSQFSYLYEQLDGIAKPDWSNDRDAMWFANGLQQALVRMTFDLLPLRLAVGDHPQVSSDELRGVFASKYADPWSWISAYLDEERIVLTEDAVEWLLCEYTQRLASSIEPLPARAQHYASLAALSAVHGKRAYAETRLRNAAANALGYGDHKDVFLFGVLEAVQSCLSAGGVEPRPWLADLAPAIAAIEDFTDGDETRHLPSELGDVLGETALDLLAAYIAWLMDREEYEDAANAFVSFLKSVDLANDAALAVAKTAVDSESLATVRKRAIGGDDGARRAIDSIAKLLGDHVRSPQAEPDSREEPSGPSDPSRTGAPSPSAYPPGLLRNFIETADRSTGPREPRVVAWLDYWRSQDRAAEALDDAERVSQSGVRVGAGDTLYKIAVSLHGRLAAYPWLVKAHREEYGWDQYYSSKERAVQRWEILRRDYPNRWFDFVIDTIGSDVGEPWQRVHVQHAIARLVEYFLFMGRTEIAVHIAGQAVKSNLDLVSPLDLPQPEWTRGLPAGTDPLIAVLLSRLKWPSPIVRERAGDAIAKLLLHPRWGAPVRSHLAQWIGDQSLESTAAIGLLPFLNAAEDGINTGTTRSTRLGEAVSRPSVLSAILLQHLDGRELSMPECAHLHSGTAPNDHEPSPFFSEYIGTFIPPIFSIQARTLWGVPFLRQWGYEWERIVDALGIKPSATVLRFRGQQERENYPIMDSRVSEVYRSSYLRTIAWAVATGSITEQKALALTIGVCPVDLGLWRVQPTAIPEWWPRVSKPQGAIDTVPAQVWTQVQALWGSQSVLTGGKLIGSATGRVYDEDSVYDLDVFGVLQARLGADDPGISDIVSWAERIGSAFEPMSLEFEGILPGGDPSELAEEFAGWGVLPVCCRVDPWTSPTWQYWRMYRGTWLPVSFLIGSGSTFVSMESGLKVLSGEQVIGEWIDWPFRLNEKLTANLPPSTGCALLLDAELIREFTRRHQLAFAWACRLRSYQRKYEHEVYQFIDSFQEFGATRLILP